MLFGFTKHLFILVPYALWLYQAFIYLRAPRSPTSNSPGIRFNGLNTPYKSYILELLIISSIKEFRILHLEVRGISFIRVPES